MSSLSRAGKMSLTFAKPAPPELSVDDIIRDIQRQVIKFKCRLIDIFQDYDKTKNGIISRSNYLRAFGRSSIVISEAHKIKLADHFSTVGDLADVNYKLMCRRIDEVNVIKGLDKNPNASTTTATVNAVTGYAGRRALSVDERELADKTLEIMRVLCSEQSLDPNSHFKDFDRANSGSVKAPQFKRLLVSGYSRMFFSQDALNALAKMFESAPGEVNYRAMNNMVRKPTNQQPDYRAEVALARPALTATRSQQANIDLISSMIIEKGAIDDIKDGMRNYDRLITGYVERGSFKAALADFASKFSGPDLDLIADKFEDSFNQKINYNQFCLNIQERRLENTRPPPMDYKQEQSWATVLHKIRVTQKQRRFDMLPLMKDFDRRNEQLVTESQFLRVLQHFAIEQFISDKEMSILIQKYGGKGSDRKGVSYKQFLSDLDNSPPQPSTVAIPIKMANISAVPIKTVYTIGTVMRKIKDKVSKQRIRLKELFTDFDVLRTGVITRNQFTGGLALLELSEEEQAIVCQEFASTELDGSQFQPLVQYVKFCDGVNNVFGLSNLERNPGADSDASAVTALNDDVVDPQNRLTPKEEEALRATLSNLEHYVKTQMVHLKPPFMDFDKQRRGYITRQRFVRALRQRCPQLNGTEVALISKAFSTPKTDSGDNVNYLWFIKAVDSADNVLGNLGQISRGAAMPKSTGKGQVQEAPAARIRNLVKLDIKSLLLKLRAQSQALSIDKPETFFQEFDPLNSGSIHQGKLPSALEKAGFRLTEGDIAVIFDRYNIDGTRMNYSLLLHHLLECGGPEGSGSGQRQSERIISKLKQHVAQRRLEVMGVFTALDKHREGQVTETQFKQALSVLRLTPDLLTRHEVKILVDDYKTNASEVVIRVRYKTTKRQRGFADDIDP